MDITIAIVRLVKKFVFKDGKVQPVIALRMVSFDKKNKKKVNQLDTMVLSRAMFVTL